MEVLLFLLYRKVRKLEKIVYNEDEIKNDMTKERKGGFRHDVVYGFVCFGSLGLRYLTILKFL